MKTEELDLFETAPDRRPEPERSSTPAPTVGSTVCRCGPLSDPAKYVCRRCGGFLLSGEGERA